MKLCGWRIVVGAVICYLVDVYGGFAFSILHHLDFLAFR